MMSRTDDSSPWPMRKRYAVVNSSLSPATLQYPMGNCQRQRPIAAAHSEPLSGPKRRSRSRPLPASSTKTNGCRGGGLALLRPLSALIRSLFVYPRCKTCCARPLFSLEANSIDDERTSRNPAGVRGIHNTVQRVHGLGSTYI